MLDNVWSLLERGQSNRHDAFHIPVLCTVGLDNAPEARTVVLRKVLRDSRAIMCHVDLRSPKAAEIKQNPKVSWLFYDPKEKLQLRIRGKATIHTNDDLAEKQWQASQLFSRRCYCGDAPGTFVDAPSSGLPAFLEDRQPTAEEAEAMGRKNFAVINSIIDELDVYELNVKGHRRSLFVFHENGEIETKWQTP